MTKSGEFPAGRHDETAEQFVRRLDRPIRRGKTCWLVQMRLGWYEVRDGPAGPRDRLTRSP